MKRVLVTRTYDPADDTSTGYTVEIGRRKNGKYAIYCTGRSRWSGNITGDVWRVEAEHDTIEQARDAAQALDVDELIERAHYMHDYSVIACIKAGRKVG